MVARDEQLKDELGDDQAYDEEEEVETATTRQALYDLIQRDIAASRIQLAWRFKALGHDRAKVIAALRLDESATCEKPRRDVAREAASQMLPKAADGEPFPMSAGLCAFDEFGVEVATYMRFIVYTGRIGWVVG